MAHWRDVLDPTAPDGRYLRWKDVEFSTGISRTTAWRLQRDGEFPRPYLISRGRVGYRESEIEAWKASRAQRLPAEIRPAGQVLPPQGSAGAPTVTGAQARRTADTRRPSDRPTAPPAATTSAPRANASLPDAQMRFEF